MVAPAAIVVVTLALVLAYAQRRVLAREALVGWLQSRGVEAQAQVGDFSPTAFSGRIRAGPAGDPDFEAENVVVRYSLEGFWSGRPFGLQVRSVRLIRPVLKARWRDGRLSMGSLDPLIEEFRRRPPRPDARQPAILIERGLARLDSPYGEVRLRADARLEDGRLLALAARTEPGRLRGHGLDADLGTASLGLVVRGDRVDLALDAPVRNLRAGGARLERARFRLAGQGPYPDLVRRRGDGIVSLRLIAEAGLARAGEAQLLDSRWTATFHGRSAGWLETLALRGTAVVEGQAAGGGTAEGRSGPIRLGLTAPGMAWTRTGGDAVRSPLRLRIAGERLVQGQAAFQTLSGDFRGAGLWNRGGFLLNLDGSANGRGAFAGMGPVRGDDLPEIAAIKRAAQDFTLGAPGLRAEFTPGGASLALTAPVRVRPRTGGEATLAAMGGAPVFRRGGGAFQLATRGGGLPEARLAVSRYRLGPEGFAGEAALRAKGDLGAARGAELDAAGDLRVAAGRTSFTARRCARVTAERLELGENDAQALGAEICQAGQPLFTLEGGRWRVLGRVRDGGLTTAFLQARVSEARGTVAVGGGPQGLDVALDVAEARLSDTASPLRFNALGTAGRLTLRGQLWAGRFDIVDPAGRRLGQATMRHDAATASGAVELDSGELVLSEGGLQPQALSPLAAPIGSPASGRVRFSGAFAWSPAGSASQGRLSLQDVGFQSPAGAVAGLSGDVALTSLAPLAAAPGQTLEAESIAAFAPVTKAKVTFALADEVLKIAAGRADVGGGQIWLDPFDLALAPKSSWNAVLHIENVQLADLVEASPFGDRMDLTAKVSGRVPFAVSPRGVRISQGELHAVEPGRLSIRREALGGVAAAGQAVPEAPGAPPTAATQAPNAFTDFAYQAMENLRFDALSAEINSLPEGRLGVLFRIKGEHQPPQHQEIRVSAAALLDRSFLDKPLPLPSGVKVDLTLDTSLNLDQLLGDYAGYRELRYSDPVQPPGATKGEHKPPERTR